MSYKTLLVHIDDSRHGNARIALALDLAQRWVAHLIGLYVVCTRAPMRFGCSRSGSALIIPVLAGKPRI